MPRFKELTEIIDNACYEEQGTPKHPGGGHRSHMGASGIGQECLRAIWYGFRHVTQEKFPGRVLRLFDRGHEEEFRFVDWLKMVGCEIEDYDPDTIEYLMYHPESDSYEAIPSTDFQTLDKMFNAGCSDVTDEPQHVARAKTQGVELRKKDQFKVVGVMGHFGGSLDGKVWNVPATEHLVDRKTKMLAEFKTHGITSFKKLLDKESVRTVKPEHYSQMSIYMHGYNLPYALYAAVHKDTDDLYFEIIKADPDHAIEMLERADKLIRMNTPPPRISNSPSWFSCKWCSKRPQCHYGAPLDKNCRTCQFARATEGGRWGCTQTQELIPKEVEPMGCDKYKMITD